eukprot:6798-Eustigmatos_ZCMA.PRE.1
MRRGDRLPRVLAHHRCSAQLVQGALSHRLLPPKPSVARHRAAKSHGSSEFDTSVDGVEVRLSPGGRQGQ